jgi:hypothetical protein
MAPRSMFCMSRILIFHQAERPHPTFVRPGAEATFQDHSRGQAAADDSNGSHYDVDDVGRRSLNVGVGNQKYSVYPMETENSMWGSRWRAISSRISEARAIRFSVIRIRRAAEAVKTRSPL